MPEPFDWKYVRWASANDLANYLTTQVPRSQLRGFVLHHTWSPIPANWKGEASMAALKTYYRDEVIWYDEDGHEHKGWWSGPNLFVCKGSPRLEWDGLFQGTPLGHAGTHSNVCNTTHDGVEAVWNGDLTPWSAVLLDELLDVFVVLCRWIKITKVTPQNIRGHRECGSTKSCPGSKNNMDHFRALLAARLVASPPIEANPLHAKTIQGADRAYFCGTGFYEYYNTHGGVQTMGLPLTDETPAKDELNRDCTYMIFERQCLKYVEGEGVRPALIEKAYNAGWFPWS